MSASKAQNALSVITDRATGVLAVIGGLLLLAMVVVIAGGVVARYVFNSPILGINEIVQLNAVALTMLAMPYATSQGVHVRADIFDRFITRWGRYGGDILTRVLSIIALWHLTDRAYYKALDAYEFEDVTNMLSLPLWPFYGLIGLGMALCIVVFAIQLIGLVIGGVPKDD